MNTQRLALAALWLIGACSLEQAGAGDSCHRSTQCAAGLACVRGVCSRDLGPIADESTVPDLGGADASAADSGGDASAADSGADASAVDSGADASAAESP
jgi:hypothetical protein